MREVVNLRAHPESSRAADPPANGVGGDHPARHLRSGGALPHAIAERVDARLDTLWPVAAFCKAT